MPSTFSLSALSPQDVIDVAFLEQAETPELLDYLDYAFINKKRDLIAVLFTEGSGLCRYFTNRVELKGKELPRWLAPPKDELLQWFQRALTINAYQVVEVMCRESSPLRRLFSGLNAIHEQDKFANFRECFATVKEFLLRHQTIPTCLEIDKALMGIGKLFSSVRGGPTLNFKAPAANS